MHLDAFNALDQESAARELRRCCGSSRWVESMVRARPFPSVEAIADISDAVWTSLDGADWLEAFAAHPRIGEDGSGGLGRSGGSGESGGLAAPTLGGFGPSEGGSGRSGGLAAPKLGGFGPSEGGSGESRWEAEEQSDARSATDDARERLIAGNRQYEARFGYIFIVCATGKTVDQMLEILDDRLQNDPLDELGIAAEEQRQITRVRLAKLLADTDGHHMITTHVLDTARGRPAVGVTVILEWRHTAEWSPIGRGTTDEDGRLVTLTDGRELMPGTYCLTFDTGTYHRDQGISMPFFPEAKITFYVRDADEHYHVPLLLSPFGYSTYRGA